MSGEDFVHAVAAKLRKGDPVEPITVREFLGRFFAQRRGYWIVHSIREALKEAGLETEPDFRSAHIDAEIRFDLLPQAGTASEAIEDYEEEPDSEEGIEDDPTYRISRLVDPNRPLVTVTSDSKIEEAVTLMMTHSFSQLPVMSNERDVKGMVSWASIGSRLAMSIPGKFARELMDAHVEIRHSASIFEAIPIITRHGYVLVRGMDARISGIVTASDLSEQFEDLTKSFLVIGEIENHIRALVGRHFTNEEVAECVRLEGRSRNITRVADLVFGDYVRILENEERWCRVGIPVDRVLFCKMLDEVREIRNDVVHFDPDGITEGQSKILYQFHELLQRLRAIGAW